MYIKNLSIRNFRNFKSTKLNFKKECVNTIVGENSSGKTNIFEAMRLILDDSLPYYKRFLSEKDFHRGCLPIFGQWILISLELGDISGDEESEILCQLNATVDAGGTGRVTYIYRPQFHIREKLFNLSSLADLEKRKEAYDQLLKEYIIDKTTYEAWIVYQGTCDFSDEKEYVKVVGDFSNFIFPNPSLGYIDLLGHRQRGYNLLDHISCTYARALRDVVSELKNNRFNPFQKLLDFISKDISNNDELTSNILDVNKKISTISEVRKLSSGILTSITNAVGSTYSPLVNISSELPSEVKDLVKVLQLKAGDSLSDGYTADLSEMSLGGANLIYLALKLYEYEEGVSKNLLSNFLIIEEPESHIHTHIQKTLFSNLKNKKTQVFISTHSTHISSVSNISSTNVLVKKLGYTQACSPSSGLDDSTINKIERFLDAIRTDILFAKNVMLIEGDAEEILIPHLVKNSFGVTLDELGVSLISVRGTGFELLSSLFHPSRITKKCAILTDDDINIYNDGKPEYITQVMYDDAISSEKSGKESVEALQLLTANNELLKAYFTKHTFEIDLALSGSKKYFEIIARESFEKDFYLIPYLDAFQSSDDTKIGSFALKLANKHKKGWFAMKVVEKLDHNFPIPIALCKALGFTSDFNKLTLARVIKYRCDYYTKSLGENIIDLVFSDDSLEYIVDNIEPVLDVFKGHYSNDPLTHLLMEA